MNIKSQVISLATALLIFMSAQFVWSKAADVVWFEKAIGITSSEEIAVFPGDHDIVARVSGYKVRECDFIPDSQLGYIKVQGPHGIELREADFEFLLDPSPNSTRPRSWFYRQNLGLWQWTDLDPPNVVTAVMATVGHDCDGQIRTTTLGPFKYPFPAAPEPEEPTSDALEPIPES